MGNATPVHNCPKLLTGLQGVSKDPPALKNGELQGSVLGPAPSRLQTRDVTDLPFIDSSAR